jgi:valyl-tRNA synthetase
MDIQEILKSTGLTVGDIRSRHASGVIKMDDDKVEDLREDIGDISEVRDFGKFIALLSSEIDFNKYKNMLLIVGFDSIMSGKSNIENELTEYLKDWSILRTSSSDGIFIKKGKPDDRGILFDMEGGKPFYKKVEVTKRTSIDIDKLKKDLDTVNKQLSNKKFIDNAPASKVEEAKAKKERIERQLKELESNESLNFLKSFKNF